MIFTHSLPHCWGDLRNNVCKFLERVSQVHARSRLNVIEAANSKLHIVS